MTRVGRLDNDRLLAEVGVEVATSVSSDFDVARRLIRRDQLMLKAGDALHLAAALRMRAAVVSFDRQMRLACEALGLAVAPD
jgi:uncharacterized protein